MDKIILPMAKYTGKYRDLIPSGYIFQKLYASNYRNYRKEFGICKKWLHIWQKGNDIEIMDFFSKSGWLIQKIVMDRDKIPSLIDHGSFSIKMNTKNGKIYLLDQAERKYIWKIEYRLYKREDKKALDLYYKKWKKSHIPEGMITEILRLYDAGLIEFEDMEFSP